MKVLILTISDQVPGSNHEELAGPHIEKILLHHFPRLDIARFAVAGEAEEIRKAFEEHTDADFIITAGAAGISPGDIVPEVTTAYCERLVPGIAEMLRYESLKHTPYAALSRGVAGIKNKTLIINIPGSLKAALLCTRLLIPFITHAPKMLRGEAHESYEPGFMGLGSNHPAR